MIYWLLTTEYPPFFGGGIGTYCQQTARMLMAKNISVTVFINDSAVADISINHEDGVRLIRFNPSRTNSYDFLGHTTNISYEFAMVVKHFINLEGAPDVIESQEYLGIAYYLLNFKKLLTDWCRNIPVVITVHSPSFLYMEYNHVSRYRYPNFWICEMEKYCLVAADLVISPGKHIIAEVRQRFDFRNKEIIIRNPYQPSHQTNIQKDNGDEILFFGKLTIQKGIPKLIHYFESMWNNGLNKQLTLIGGQDIVYYPEGLEMGDIVRKKFKPYIEKGLLKLEDRIKPASIASRLQSAALVIIPSEHDNFPYVVLEMLALGKIILVSKQGGHSEIIHHGINGFIFDHDIKGDFQKVFQQIERLTSEEKITIAKNAKLTLEEVSYKKIAEEKLAALALIRNKASAMYPFIRLHKDPPLNDSKAAGTLLSIVIPFYDMGEFIADTLASVFKIDYSNYEVIIINDGSKDADSVRMIESIKTDARVKVIDLEHRGLAAARNAGAQIAKGAYLAFLDADDLIEPSYYSRSIEILKQYQNVHFVGAWVQYFDNNSGKWPAFTPEFPLILYQNLINSSGLVYKRNSFLNAGLNDGLMPFMGWEDYDSVISMIKHGYSGVVIPELLFRYRVRQTSMVRALSVNKKRLLSEYLLLKHSDVYATFATDLLNLQNANGPGFHIDNPSADHHLSDNIPFGKKFSGTLIRMVKKNAVIRAFAYRIYKMLK